jgi:hypothetical protein
MARGRRLRRAALVGASGLALAVAASGCQSTSSSCVGERCDANLQGSGAEVELDSLDVEITLLEAGQGTALLDVDGTEVRCKQGEIVEAPDVSIQCGEVGEDAVGLRAAGS